LYGSLGWGVLFAADARTGKQLWRWDPEIPRGYFLKICCGPVNRGVALYNGKVFVLSEDGDTFVIQAGTMKAGLLTLRGMRVDVRSLINFFQIAMPRENWKPKGGFHTKRTVLIFEKPDKTCVINLFETTLYTYAEIYVAPASGGPL